MKRDMKRDQRNQEEEGSGSEDAEFDESKVEVPDDFQEARYSTEASLAYRDKSNR